ncbi:MAG: CoB--CoM heterodisulfide reductase subunit C [Methanomassiliicoccaceae archaeon]|jgi:heterodisulfide reductase subunit C|nr:CoB--CoM heterodisulfide reductase subunit C [Methanomassiliicoccaceae archaeon]
MVAPVPGFTDEIAKNGGATVMLCFQCGTCTAGCPSGKFVAYRIRKLMRAAQLGLKDETVNSEDLWQCTTCYTCSERCPRDVQIVDVVTALRNIAVVNGKMYDGHKKVAANLIKVGHTVDNNDKIKALRKELGLPENPPTVMNNPAAMADFDKILNLTGFKKLVA